MKKEKIISLVLAVIMCLTLIPTGIFAEEEGGEGAPAEETCTHTMEYVEKVEANCQHSGMEAHYHCTTCDGLFSDAQGNVPVEGEDLIIPILEHKWDEGTVTREATPSQKGIRTYKCTTCGTTFDEEFDYVEPSPAADSKKKFTLDGNKLSFKKKVVIVPPKFMAGAKVDHVWIKAGKKRMTVNWKVIKDMKVADGVKILRRDGTAKLYKEIAEVPFKVSVDGYMDWQPKTSYVDKTAKKKNTAYTYIAVAYVKEDNYTYISHCSDWASGQTTASKLKNAYTAKISKKSAELQLGGKVTLKLTIANPKTIYDSKSFRWYSDDKAVAKVSKKGVVTAKGIGTTVIRGRLSSGKDITCKVSVVGAFKPAAPKLSVDVADKKSITLKWSKSKYATEYHLYRSDDGIHWKDPYVVKGTTKKVTDHISSGKKYTFYVVAINNNQGHTAKSKASNLVNQKAVIKRRPTSVTGLPKAKTLTSGAVYIAKLKITSPDGRKANLQFLNGKKWETKKTVTLPKGAGTTSVSLKFPNTWWGKKTTWRLVIAKNNTSEAYTSHNVVITGKRRYQNPSKYIQIKDTITSHGYGYYLPKVRVNSASVRSDHVEALIYTANRYKGDKYVAGRAGAPGKGIDAEGLIMQACYGAGIDLWPISPYTRPSDCIKKIMESKLEFVTSAQPDPSKADYPGVYRGDLIFFTTEKNKVGHVAIYLGLGKVLHASQVAGKVQETTLSSLVSKSGKYKYKVKEVRRLFVFD